MVESILHSHDAETDTDKVGEPVFGDIRKEWHWVRPGIEEILSLAPHFTFRPEDVYAACISQRAVLWVAEDGFVVSTSESDPFTDERSMFLWLAWAKERGKDLVSKYQPFFEQVAREAGYTQMETRSPFLQLVPHLTNRGWSVDTVVYTRKL
jgi:hypothetical protein